MFKPISCLALLLFSLSLSPLYAETDELDFDETPARRVEREETQKFLDAVPHGLEIPADVLKTHVIDMKTFEIARSFDGYFRDYWPDLDIVLTESVYEIYYVDSGETRERPKRDSMVWCQGRDYDYRTDLTLWNRTTGEKIRTVTGDNVYSPSWDDIKTELLIIDRKAMLFSKKTETTTVVDLVTGESVGTIPGWVSTARGERRFLVVFEREDKNISIYDPQTLKPLCTVPTGTMEWCDDHSRFVVLGKGVGTNVVVYDLKTGKKINVFHGGFDAELNRDGTRLLIRRAMATDTDELSLWNVDTGEKLWEIPFGGKGDYTFCFSDDGRIVTGDCDLVLPCGSDDYPRTYVWNARTGKELAMPSYFSMKEYFGKVNRMIGSGPSLLNATTGEWITEIRGWRVTAVSEGEKRFVTSRDKTLFVWDTETGKPLGEIKTEAYISHLDTVAFDADAALLRVTRPNERVDSRFAFWTDVYEIATGKVVRCEETLPGDDSQFKNIVWKFDGRNTAFWNTDTEQAFFVIRLVPPERGEYGRNIVAPIRFTPDGAAMMFSNQVLPYYDD